MATGITLESLGLSREEITERLIDQLADQFTSKYSVDEDGEDVFSGASDFSKELRRNVKERIDKILDDIAERVLMPQIQQRIEDLVINNTNAYGEKVGESRTLTEYLVERCNAFLTEKVDSNGRTDSASWGNKQPRIMYLVADHLRYAIEQTIKELTKDANQILGKSIEQTVKEKLAEMTKSIRVGVTTTR